jgi:hypothetical protein
MHALHLAPCTHTQTPLVRTSYHEIMQLLISPIDELKMR